MYILTTPLLCPDSHQLESRATEPGPAFSNPESGHLGSTSRLINHRKTVARGRERGYMNNFMISFREFSV